MNWIKWQLARLVYLLKHGRDDYGKLGFTQLFYKGKPLLIDKSIPENKIRFFGDDGIRELDIVTGKITRYVVRDYKTKKDGTLGMRFKKNRLMK